MTSSERHSLLDPLLLSWDRHNTILLNLLNALPAGGLDARATDSSPTVAQMFNHMHHERMVSVLEEAPEFAGEVPEREWEGQRDPALLGSMLIESAQRVGEAVRGRITQGKAFDLNFEHPLLLIPFLIFHEGYHHGQIKLALKAAGCPLSDEQAAPITWGVWRRRD